MAGADRPGLPGFPDPARFRRTARTGKCVLAPVGCSSNLCPYEDHPFPHRYFDGTVYLNLTSDPFVFPGGGVGPDRLRAPGDAARDPRGRTGLPFAPGPGREEARRPVPSLRAVILTYGKASRQHGRRIAEVFPGARRSISTARPRRGTFLSARPFGTIPRRSTAMPSSSSCRGGRSCPDVFQIYVTTRDREAMPLLRYHTGDIVQRTASRASGSSAASGTCFSGRTARLCPPTTSMPPCPADFACWHYALVQTGDAAGISTMSPTHRPTTGPIEAALAPAPGAGVRVNAFRRRRSPRRRAASSRC